MAEFAAPVFGIKAKPMMQKVQSHLQFAAPVFGIKAKRNGVHGCERRQFMGGSCKLRRLPNLP